MSIIKLSRGGAQKKSKRGFLLLELMLALLVIVSVITIIERYKKESIASADDAKDELVALETIDREGVHRIRLPTPHYSTDSTHAYSTAFLTHFYLEEIKVVNRNNGMNRFIIGGMYDKSG